jgi:hypothetical protein
MRRSVWAGVAVVLVFLVVVPAAASRGNPHRVSVALDAPAADATLRGPVTLSARPSAGRHPVSRVDFLVDNRLVGTARSAPWSLSWNSASVADGSHRVSAVAYDTHRDSAAASQTNTTSNAAPETRLSSGPANPTFDTVASFSFTSDTQGATFRCSLDGAAATACSSPASYSGLDTGAHTFSVAAVDGSGVADGTPAGWSWSIQPDTNLVANSTFEGTRSGWGSGSAVLTLVNDGTQGPGALRVAWNGTSSLYAVTSAWQKWPVPVATLGHTYVGGAWIRSDAPGRKVCLTIREWKDNFATWIGSSSSCVTTTSAWQQVPTLYFAQTFAGDGLDISINQQTAPGAGDSFEVDGVTLRELPPAAQPQASDPTLLAVGDVAGCWRNSDEQTANIVRSMPWAQVQLLGDNAYPNGTAADYRCYDNTWGAFKDRTHPAPGNHDYDTPDASVYYSYFGAAAGDPAKGWYSYDVGTWHVIVLNSNCTKIGGCWRYSPQELWLRNDLRTHRTMCTLAVMHHPPYTSVDIDDDGPLDALWADLANEHADLVLAGHAHAYERFAPMDASGHADPNGTREITVGTGGAELMTFGTILPTSEVRAEGEYGVLGLVLHAGSYDWSFVPVLGEGPVDAGSASCR